MSSFSILCSGWLYIDFHLEYCSSQWVNTSPKGQRYIVARYLPIHAARSKIGFAVEHLPRMRSSNRFRSATSGNQCKEQQSRDTWSYSMTGKRFGEAATICSKIEYGINIYIVAIELRIKWRLRSGGTSHQCQSTIVKKVCVCVHGFRKYNRVTLYVVQPSYFIFFPASAKISKDMQA